MDDPHLKQYSILQLKTQANDEWNLVLDYVVRSSPYVVVVGTLLAVIALILKFMGNIKDDGETNPSLPKDAILDQPSFVTYGTWEEDLEFGNSAGRSSGSSEDLYDGKICLLCSEKQRNCFFLPCGHFITCFACTHRIIEEENKSCPVCRRPAHSIRRLFLS